MLPSQFRVISEDEFFGFKIQKLWFFQDQPDRFFINLFSHSEQSFDHLKVNLFVLDKKRFHLIKCVNSVDEIDLIEELNIVWSVFFKSLFMEYFQRWNMRKFEFYYFAHYLYFWWLFVELFQE